MLVHSGGWRIAHGGSSLPVDLLKPDTVVQQICRLTRKAGNGDATGVSGAAGRLPQKLEEQLKCD